MPARHPGSRRPSLRGAVAALVAAALTLGLAVTGAPTPAQAAPPTGPATVTGGHADWGVRASFRSYVTGPVAGGSITTGAGTTNADGTFRWPDATGTTTAGAGTVDAAFDGTVQFVGHAGALDMTISGLEVALTGPSSGTLHADVVSRSLSTGAFATYTDVAFATLDPTGIVPSESGDTYTWSGIPASLTADGSAAFAGFYPAGTALDPVTIALELEAAPTWVPQISVSKTTDIDAAGETVTVTGTGFDPNANISTRPPVPVGMPTGIYVVFGRFADTWKPSQGAPSSARRVLDQKWPLPAASKAATEAAFGPNAQYVVLQPDGSFTTTLQLAPNHAFAGNYGIATYAAGGSAPNAAQETFTPVSFLAATGIDASASIPDFVVTGNKDLSKFKVEIANVDVNELTVSPADIDVTVEVNGVLVSDPVVPSSTNPKKLKAGKTGSYTYAWTHGSSLHAADVVSVTACVDVASDDTSSNDCSTTVSPSGSVDVTTLTMLPTISSKKSSVVFKTTVTNSGSAPVLLRPEDVVFQLYVDDVLVGGIATSKTELGKRSLVKPTKQKSYTFVWEYGAVSIGDVVEVVTCVPVPSDVSPGDNCSEASYLVVK